MEGLGFTEIASLYLLLLVLEYGHRRLHAQEAKLPIEGLFARHSVQDDLLVTARDFDQMSYDLLAQSGTLMTRQCGNVADVRAIRSIGERSACSNQLGAFIDEALKHAVGEDLLQMHRLFIAQGGGSVQGGEFVPIDRVVVVFPFERHANTPW